VQKIVDGYFLLLKSIIVLCLALMVILVFGNVVLRYALNTGITISEEVSRFLFVWLTFVAAALRDIYRSVDAAAGEVLPWITRPCPPH
jgi:TRAP-type C4-dicarboxylate transport system permease small subunit